MQPSSVTIPQLSLREEEDSKGGYQFKLTDFYFVHSNTFCSTEKSRSNKIQKDSQVQPHNSLLIQKQVTEDARISAIVSTTMSEMLDFISEGDTLPLSPLFSTSSNLQHASINTEFSLATEGLGFHLQEILHPVSPCAPSILTSQSQKETGVPSSSSSLPSQSKGKGRRSPRKKGKTSSHSTKVAGKSKHSGPKIFSFPLVESPSMRDDLFNQYLNSVGFSKSALKAAIGSVRPATNKIYNVHFSKFCMYLKNKKHLKDLRDVKIKHLADYFLFLDAELQLSFAKIMSIRTAMRTPLHLVNRKDILLSPELKLVLKGIKAGKNPIRPNPVAWNLPRVLDYLKSKPFFHLKTLSEEKLLSKTLFLLAMASGKRASELAALGAAHPYCIFPHGERVILGYLPGFLAKNESLEHLHGSCILDSLKTITPDREEYELCPVRTLKQYLIKTKSSDRIPQLFRKLGKNAPLSTRAISSNLVNTIRSAYSTTSGIETLTGQVKGHDVRAVAASLQMRNYPS